MTTPETGRLVVDCSHASGAFLMAATGPNIEVDGKDPIIAQWGPWPVDVPAGSHHVRVTSRYRGGKSPAEITVDVPAGEEVKIFYRTPALIWMRGSIGRTPQPTAGMGAMIALLGLLFLIMVLLPLMA